MTGHKRKLRNAPIVEAVVDIDCDLRPGFDLTALEEQARACFRDKYPHFRRQFSQEFKVEESADASLQLSARQAVQALQFLQNDKKQLVQVRVQGFSFNRLEPYSTLDDYMPEIERAWQIYVQFVIPVEVRTVRLRYINRILLPLVEHGLDIDEYIKNGPRLVDEDSMDLTGFLIRHNAVERVSSHQIDLVLTAQPPESDNLPVILDISVANPLRGEPNNWHAIRESVQSLRTLKNRIFFSMLTDKCLQMFG